MWNPFKKSAPVERKAVLGTSESLGSFLMFGTKGAETPSSALSLYRQSSAVSVPVNKIVSAFAGISPVIQDIENDELITSHELLDLLNKPSPFYEGMLFREALAKDYLITNEAFFVSVGNINRPPLELQPISPTNVSVVEGSGGLARSIQISGNTLTGDYKLNKDRYLDGGLRELKQIRGYSTRNNSLLRGESLLVSAASEARQHILGNDHNISILEKGGRVSLVFHFDADLSPDDFEATKDRVRAQYGGASNAGEIGVTSGGKLDIKETGTNNKDMDFAVLQRAARDSVALQYNVPLTLMSTDAATFNNYDASKTALYDDAVLPLADRIYTGLGTILLPRYKLDPSKYRITYNILNIPALRMRTLKEIELRSNINIESDNELRGMIGREDYQGGDDILKPANLIPAGTDLFKDVE